MNSMIAFLTPVKTLQHAKSRLSGWFDDTQRAELVAAMLHDVQQAIRQACPDARRIVVTADCAAASIARANAAEVVTQSYDAGMASAIDEACATAMTEGDVCVVLPCDVPLAQAEDLRQLAAAATQSSVVLVPDRHGIGTNAMAFRVPRQIDLCFGRVSLAAHIASAQARALPFRVLELASLMHDIDVPADLFVPAAAQEAAEPTRRVGLFLRDAARHKYYQPTW